MVLLVREFLVGFDYRTGYLLLGFRIPYMLLAVCVCILGVYLGFDYS